ncbi:MAG: tetratricopeptide repeat protein [Desulfurivibrio sp.]|nr:tetratricopeptide repeat protein [Desulfurivibrio sp.]
MKVEIDRCLAALQRLDMEVFLVDITHPQLEIPALYTIVPGAHFRERSDSRHAGLFAAKLAHELVTPAAAQVRKLEEMATIMPQAYFIEFFLGKKKAAMGDFEQAITHFHRSLSLRPEAEDLPYIYAYLGECLKDKGDFEEAIAALERGLAEDEERQDIHNMLGFCHYKRGAHHTAVNHFSRAIEIEPGSAIDFANLGINQRLLGDYNEAARNLKIALTMDPYLELARRHLDEMYNELGAATTPDTEELRS